MLDEDIRLVSGKKITDIHKHFGDIWNEYCKVCNVPTDGELYSVIEE